MGRVTGAGADQCAPSQDRASSTVVESGETQAVYSWPVTGSAAEESRQQRMPTGPPPAWVVTVEAALQVRPPSREVRAETVLAGGASCGATRRPCSAPMRLSGS